MLIKIIKCRSKMVIGRAGCLFLLVVFMFDSVFHISRFLLGGSNIGRIGLLGLMTLLMLISLITRRRLTLNKMDCAVLVLVILLIFGYLKAILFAGDMSIANTFIKNGFVYLLFLPIMYYSIDSIDKAEVLLKYVTLIGVITSILSIIIEISHVFSLSIANGIVKILYDLEVIVLNLDLGTVQRIMLSGMVFQVVGIFGGIYFAIRDNKRWFWISIFAVNALGVLFTFARGLIAGLVMGLCVWFLLSLNYDGISKKWTKRIKMIIILGGLILIIYTLVGQYGNVFYYFVERLLKISNDGTREGVIARHIITSMTMEKIVEAPLFGGGLGAHIDYRDGYIEYTYFDIIMKIGLFGLIVFLFPYLTMVYDALRTHLRLLEACIFCSFTAVLIASYSNPYLITSLGIFTYCLCIRVFTLSELKNNI